jgi:hypothetical protein
MAENTRRVSPGRMAGIPSLPQVSNIFSIAVQGIISQYVLNNPELIPKARSMSVQALGDV